MPVVPEVLEQKCLDEPVPAYQPQRLYPSALRQRSSLVTFILGETHLLQAHKHVGDGGGRDQQPGRNVLCRGAAYPPKVPYGLDVVPDRRGIGLFHYGISHKQSTL